MHNREKHKNFNSHLSMRTGLLVMKCKTVKIQGARLILYIVLAHLTVYS